MYSNKKYYENICNCLRVIQQYINRKLKSDNCWQRTSLKRIFVTLLTFFKHFPGISGCHNYLYLNFSFKFLPHCILTTKTSKKIPEQPMLFTATASTTIAIRRAVKILLLTMVYCSPRSKRNVLQFGFWNHRTRSNLSEHKRISSLCFLCSRRLTR